MARISEHIDRHVRRAKERIVNHAIHHARRVPREVSIAFSILLGIIIVLSAFYWREESRVQRMNTSQPIACHDLSFPANARLCVAELESAYKDAPALAREPICDRAGDRSRFGTDSALCAIYDSALAEQRYAAPLADHGITVWEPDANISTASLRLEARTLNAISALHLVCDGGIVPTNWSGNGTRTTLALERPVSGSCVLIASTAEGSITSEKFTLVER